MTALRIGTRGSLLALAQARAVASALDGAAELVTITTAGDVDRARGDKSRWTGALEAALLAGDIDLAVHSAKDVPGELAAGTAIVAAPRRADPLDVLVGEARLEDLREGARVGTSALRRRAQLLAARPDLAVAEVRGNVDTRLRKRAAGEYDALVLAAAGLERLGRRDEAGGALAGEVFVPAAGQGVIAVQARTGTSSADAAAAVNHDRTLACLQAERAAIRALEANCHAPVGVHAQLAGDSLQLRGFAGLPDGSEWIVDELGPEDRGGGPGGSPAGGPGGSPAGGPGGSPASGPGGSPGDQGAPDGGGPEAAGLALAERMIAAGARDLLRAAEAMAA